MKVCNNSGLISSKNNYSFDVVRLRLRSDNVINYRWWPSRSVELVSDSQEGRGGIHGSSANSHHQRHCVEHLPI